MASLRKRSISSGRLADTDELRRPVEVAGEPDEIAVELRAVVHDLHRAAAEHVGRPDHERIADARRRWRAPASGCVAMPFSGCRSLSLSSSCLKRSRSSARSIASGEVPRIGTPAFSSASASLSGVWPPNCTITPSACRCCARCRRSRARPRRQRLEIEPVGGVVVGRHRLRIAVDHDGLVAGLAQREARRGSSSSRTRCPGRCGSARRRGS